MMPQKYTYPDGTDSSRRPKDGEHYIKTNPITGQVESTWQWDDLLGQWFNTSSGKPTPYNTVTFVIRDNMPIYHTPITVTISDLKCQCGSEAVGSPKHSNWCDKYVLEP